MCPQGALAAVWHASFMLAIMLVYSEEFLFDVCVCLCELDMILYLNYGGKSKAKKKNAVFLNPETIQKTRTILDCYHVNTHTHTQLLKVYIWCDARNNNNISIAPSERACGACVCAWYGVLHFYTVWSMIAI